nr:farnesyl diphosphate synthase [Marinobacterium ramblicola]
MQQQLAQWATRVERNLDLYLLRETCIDPRLTDAMRYALLSGGKRIRPALVYMSSFLCGGTAEQADRAAAAIEAIHCYSLVHDDLPAMDDDELRRGRPTCHIAFDEATAILAGDALQCFAFELLSEPGGVEPERALQLIRILSRASGSHGMVMGQSFDLAHVGERLTLSQLQAMHAHKTGRLITASVMLGATAAGCQDRELLDALQRYGDAIGLAFQVQDDLLDIEGSTATLGKPQGSDQAQNKPTYPALLGIDGARAKLNQLHDEALNALKPFGIAAAPLAALAHFIVTRDH